MKKNIIFLFVFNIFLNSFLFAEPFVVHEYAGTSSINVNENSKNFYENEDYSTYYKIKKNDSLSGILNKFYGTNNLNLNVVKAAVLLKNKHAFVRNNANFMFANKRLYLPSVKEIKNLIYKNTKRKSSISKNFTREKEIYFFGN
ncbi:MAG: hypothetical protein CMJ06_04710 [Pelagibacterales bacterium]|nr:hypothetical protein [Pelagibacterales bacterium]OUU61833.1 MAG: hypothetical protein CBC22_06160 [Alphaproteobacteria bacterium TMED62]|tara:strand:- start:8753 stop:9184 length:432 start_codon:yes stop_codon:yes gene_type:complete